MNWNKPYLKLVGLGILLLLVIWAVTNASSGNEVKEDQQRVSQLYKNGQLDDAAREYAELVSKAPNDHELWNNYGNVLRDQRKLEEASAAYQKAISLNVRYEAAHRNLTFLHIDLEKAGQKGKIDEAIQLLLKGFKASGSKSISMAEDLANLYYNKGDQAKYEEYKNLRDKLLSEE